MAEEHTGNPREVEPRKSTYLISPEGALMRAWRIQADLTQSILAQRMGYSPASISLVEGGMSRPGNGLIAAFCRALKLDLAKEQQLLAARAKPFTTYTRSESADVSVEIGHR